MSMKDSVFYMIVNISHTTGLPKQFHRKLAAAQAEAARLAALQPRDVFVILKSTEAYQVPPAAVVRTIITG